MKKIYFLILVVLFWLYGCKTASPAHPETETDTILDAYWMLLSLEGQSPQAPNNTRTAYLRLEEKENDVKGFSGCNHFFGKYTLSGSSLRFSDLGSTRMMCPNMDQETKFMEVLGRVESYSIAGSILTFYQGQEAIATFKTGNPEDLQQEERSGKVRVKKL
ncbi:META domain-containing protein [Pontibacter fetidus]|uniref:META domain-containing protein n=1 Tax=Pontibacter fetidus TaxID=2700082 RepID=A0A6B2GYY4_9BACT|nr:META domain-containing protein [Pontibacter fetidus]NDK55253.1 META domain-containing protein [Pontibacter fetidus]